MIVGSGIDYLGLRPYHESVTTAEQVTSKRGVTRRDYFEILADLPKLPEGAMPHPSCTRENPIAIHQRTGDLYHVRNGSWVLGDRA